MHCRGYFPLLKPVYIDGKYTGNVLQQYQALPKRQRDKLITYPDVPESLDYIMFHFYRVRKATQGKISYTELKNYIDVMCLEFQGWESELLMQIDSIYESCIND